MNTARLTTLAAFIRSQANLTDTVIPVPGPGGVHLNHVDALEVATAIETALALDLATHPVRWTLALHEAWHVAIPDVPLAFAELRRAVGMVPPGACCEDERRNFGGGCDNCGAPCL